MSNKLIKDGESCFVFDGAMGTYYASIYNDVTNCEEVNLTYPERILKIHQEYIKAGCDAIKTNTFGANDQNLECTNEQIKAIIKAGYNIAKQAVEGTNCKIFADIGPCLEQKQISMFEQLKFIVDEFLACGAENFIFETYPNNLGLKEIAAYIKEVNPNSYIITSFAVTADGYTQQGIPSKRIIKEMQECCDVDACGFNCVCGPMHLHHLLNTMEKVGTISIMPNAGYPTIVQNRAYFRDNKTYFANEILKIVEDGAKIIGGCCGTTPLFIKEVRLALKRLDTKHNVAGNEQSSKPTKEFNNELYYKLESGKHIIAVEFDPPMNSNISKFMDNAEYLRHMDVDAITIADCPIARARADSSMLAAKLKREMGLEVIPHMTCRDRNINATKALLFGLEIEDIHNVLVVTGDPIQAADRNLIKGVFSFNSKILASYIKDLNETVFPHPFLIYGALNVNAPNFEAELTKAKSKIENGVSVFLTQPVLSKQALDNVKRAKKELNAKILGGIIPIVSYNNAIYMNNEIAGIQVDEEYIKLYENKTREEASKLAVELSCKIVQQLIDVVDGYYLITPFSRVEIIGEIISYIKANDELSN
ncbi:MAG: bifunctional homocysteine S-methyltransferase/methylenetetrahydrofolate reductase [Erysipelotrichaceae bacterium]